MSKPTVFSRTMPVLHVGRDMDDSARQNLLCRLTFLLIPATTSYADQHLTTALGSVMYMPIIAATWFECNISKRNLLLGNKSQVTFALEIFSVSRIRFSDRENHLSLESILGIIAFHIICPYLLG